MNGDANKFLSKALGEDFFEVLAKTELYKPNANIAIDIEDIRIGLKVVPRVVMSLLVRELPPMKIGESKTVALFLGQNAQLQVTKHDTDTYSGSIIDTGKQLVNFKFRPLPGVGLVIMSAFELYGLEELSKEPPKHFVPEAEVNVQKLIDERLALHQLVHSVVEQKMSAKEALQQLIQAKITEALELAKPAAIPVPAVAPKSDVLNESVPVRLDPVPPVHAEPVFKSVKKESPLKKFLEEKAAKKTKKNEFEFKMIKGESVNCDSCGKEIFNESVYTGCVCMGSDMDNKVFIKKSENGIKIRFPKSWDKDNILMLLDIIKNRNVK